MPSLYSLSVTDWSYNVDLAQGPGTIGVSHVEVQDYRPLESVFNQATTGDRVRINVLVEGTQRLLGDFVIDDYLVEEKPDGVVGKLKGRDAKALLLESFPSTPTTYSGVQINSDCTSTMRGGLISQSWRCADVVRDIISRAGYTSMVNIQDYVLGQDFVHPTETSFGEAITQLLTPHRVTEKHRADLFLTQSNQVIVWERTFGSPFNNNQPMNIRYQDLIDRQVERQRPTLPLDAQIYGASYTCLENTPPVSTIPAGFSGPVMGWPWFEPYTIRTSVSVNHPTLGFLLYTLRREWNFGSNGKLTSALTVKNYSSLPLYDGAGNFVTTYGHSRTETLTESREYLGPFGEITKTVTEKTVQDGTTHFKWDASLGVIPYLQKQINQTMKRATTTYEYLQDDYVTFTGQANPINKVVVNEEADEAYKFTDSSGAIYGLEYNLNSNGIGTPALPVSAPLIIRSITNSSMKNEGGQLHRSEVTERFPAGGGPVSSEIESEEMAYGRTPFSLSLPNSNTRRSVSKKFRCEQPWGSGSDSAPSKQTFSLLGRDQDCCTFRNLIIDGRNSWKIIARFTMLPDPNIVEGMKIHVTGVPTDSHGNTRWGVTDFYVTGRSFERTAQGMIMKLTGVAYL